MHLQLCGPCPEVEPSTSIPLSSRATRGICSCAEWPGSRGSPPFHPSVIPSNARDLQFLGHPEQSEGSAVVLNGPEVEESNTVATPLTVWVGHSCPTLLILTSTNQHEREGHSFSRAPYAKRDARSDRVPAAT